MKHIREFIFLLLLGLSFTVNAQNVNLRKDFLHPPQESRPLIWWHWMNGNISREGIYKDLMWMHRIGIAGFHVFDAGLKIPQIVPHRIIYMTPEWKECFRYSIYLADSLNMSVGIASAPGWSNTGGPWVKAKDAMKKISWRTMRIKGNRIFDGKLPEPWRTTGLFQNSKTADIPDSVCYGNIATLAVRLSPDDISMKELNPKIISSSGMLDLNALSDEDVEEKQIVRADKSGKIWVLFDFHQPQTLKALSIADGRCRDTWNYVYIPILYHLESSADGVTFRKVCDIPQSGAMEQTIDIPATRARYFRVVCDQPESDKEGKLIRLSELVFYTTNKINFAEEKAGFTSYGDLANHPTPSVIENVFSDEVINLTTKVNSNGYLHWKVPQGNWEIYRFGWSLTGKQNHPASPEATGLEVDKMDSEAVKDYMEYYLNLYKNASGGMLGKCGIHDLLIDSYEAGRQTWTPLIAQEFEKRRGYSLYKWLPVLAGQIIGSSVTSEKFLFDYRKTIGELIEENLYGQVAKMARKRDLQTYFESNEWGRQFLADGLSVKSKADIPMGAMWAGKYADIYMYECDLKESSSAAHIYGKSYIAGESFTVAGNHEDEYSYFPGNLKSTADRELSCGVNRFVIHESSHQPDDVHQPGPSLDVFGQWFTRHETWAEEARPWIDYLTRNSYMLQQGRYVADIAYYYGEDNSVNGLFGQQHPRVPKGYSYDFINPEALAGALSFDGKNIVTTGGMKYRLLVLDKNCVKMTLPYLRKIDQLVRKGAPIWGQRPLEDPSLGEDSIEFNSLVKDIWYSGRTNVLIQPLLEDALNQLKIYPDLTSPDINQIRYIHRKIGNSDIYWVSNMSDDPLKTILSLRVNGHKPEIWHPDDGRMEPASYEIKDGRTYIKLDMTGHDAQFIVLMDPDIKGNEDIPEPQKHDVMSLNTNWDIHFQKGLGAPELIHIDSLKSYTESPISDIRYFSGTAVYTKTFRMPKKSKKLHYELNLGEVDCMAVVTLNGNGIGTLWKTPYTIDITRELRKGMNELQIKVVNLWPNRIIGDLQPGVKKKYTWCSYNAYEATSPLFPSGLLGPVKIVEVVR